MKRKFVSLLLSTVAALLVLSTACALPYFPTDSNSSATPTVNEPQITVFPPPTSSPAVIEPTPDISPVSSLKPIIPDYSGGIVNSTASPLPDYVSVIAKVRPSVVVIHTEVPTFDLFSGTTTQKGAGSGWILDSSGLIVTNSHVIEGAKTITITLDDGRSFTSDTVRSAPVTDLAVLKINAPDLQPVELGDSADLKVGQLVVAIGNSLDEGISATNGIVSAIGVSITTETGETLFDLIKTNAAINPGNSGGPLVNMEGRVIGITGAKVATIGVEGTGYAISSATAMPVVNELIKSGYVSRPWLGVSLYTVDKTAVQALGLSVNEGVLLRVVAAGSPAEKAGLKRYDVITAMDNKLMKTKEELVRAIRQRKVGQVVEVTYWRGDLSNTTKIKLEQSPPPETP